MKVYKFGGASVKDAAGVRNVEKIICQEQDSLIVVVSAMAKTTNALEDILNAYLNSDSSDLNEKLSKLKDFHDSIAKELFADPTEVLFEIGAIFEGLRHFFAVNTKKNYDFCYDQVVPMGEILSTKIVCRFIQSQDVDAEWVDVRTLLKTDSTFRDANINYDTSRVLFKNRIDFGKHKIYLTQGFIGSNHNGDSTTLGREGSDYTAAIIANILDADNVTIWKDVPGVLNADPRIFKETIHLPNVSYKQAIELAYFGAQIIHPKTIKPLQNKEIPLYVKSFVAPSSIGTEISASIAESEPVPVFILKQEQVLLSIEPKDYSFALEDSWIKVFTILQRHRIKSNLIQNSAISLTICVDGKNMQLQDGIEELMNDFRVKYNEGLKLLTVQNYKEQLIKDLSEGKEILLVQRSRRTARLLYR